MDRYKILEYRYKSNDFKRGDSLSFEAHCDREARLDRLVRLDLINLSRPSIGKYVCLNYQLISTESEPSRCVDFLSADTSFYSSGLIVGDVFVEHPQMDARVYLPEFEEDVLREVLKNMKSISNNESQLKLNF